MKGVAIVGLAVLLWAIGLVGFADKTRALTPPTRVPRADAIVALTGASDARLRAAMDLLAAGQGQRLLITGVNPDVTRADLRRILGGSKELYVCCVDLGFRAADTIGNAAETAAWVRARNIRSLIVVTADYHMPRALVELKARLPMVRLHPHAIKTPVTDPAHWRRDGLAAPRLVLEYCKYLIIRGREAVIRLGGGIDDHSAPAQKGA